MDKITQARSALRELDALAAKTSPVHRLHPLCKLLVTVVYIVTVLSFHRYDLPGLMILLLYPVVLFQAAGIPVSLCFRKLWPVLPLLCAVGLADPFLDDTVLARWGSFALTGGMVSLLTLLLKGVFSLMASFLLVSTTSMDSLCAALRKLHVPSLLTTLLLLTYRYITVLLDEAAAMTQAYALRAPGHRGLHISAWGSFLGQLLLRSMDRAGELYASMRLRSFHGEFHYAVPPPCRAVDVLFAVFSVALFLLLRCVPVAGKLGSLLMR